MKSIRCFLGDNVMKYYKAIATDEARKDSSTISEFGIFIKDNDRIYITHNSSFPEGIEKIDVTTRVTMESAWPTTKFDWIEITEEEYLEFMFIRGL